MMTAWMQSRLAAGVIIVALTSAITFGGTYYWRSVTEKERIQRAVEIEEAKLKQRVAELELRLELLTQSVEPISAVMRDILIQKLTHYHTPVVDKLLVKLQNQTLSETEERDLLIALDQRTRDMGRLIDDDERAAAAMLPLLMRQIRKDYQDILENPGKKRLKVVVVPEDTPE